MMMDNQPFFNSARVIRLFIYFLGAIALFILLGWLASRYTGTKIDWTFLIPLGGAVGTLIPIATGVVTWITKNLKENDSRIDKLEILAEANKNRLEQSEKDRGELRKILLKLEARIESLRDTQVNVQLGELVEQNRQIIQKFNEKDI